MREAGTKRTARSRQSERERRFPQISTLDCFQFHRASLGTNDPYESVRHQGLQKRCHVAGERFCINVMQPRQ